MTANRDQDARQAPDAVGATEPVEFRLAIAGALTSVGLGVPFVAGAWWLVGPGGALGAGIAVAVVAGTLLLSGGLLSLAAPFGPGPLMAAALGGYVLKLFIYALLIILLRPVSAIHGPSLAITAAVLLIVALIWQARVALKNQRLFWVDAERPGQRDSSGARGVIYPSQRAALHPPTSRDSERTRA